MSGLRSSACLAGALILAITTGCGRHKKPDARAPHQAQGPGGLSAIETRIAAAGKSWARYSPEDQALVKGGDFRVGLDELAVYIARGAPEIWWPTRQGSEVCNLLFYSTGEASVADLSVLTCSGTVVKRAALAPAISCSRLAEFAPRMVEHAAYFAELPLTRQWDLAVGALERGQTGVDIAIAYGAPYNSGSEAREDGSQAKTLVFLDRAQEAYALHVTLVDDKVVSWKIPAERILTPQAQQRHAAEAASQAVEAVRASEQQAAARYAEETRARNEAQARRQYVMDVAGTLASAAVTHAASNAPPPSANVSSSTTRSSNEKTLTLNGCSYKESGGGSLGQSCGTCPSSYVCSMVGGRTGFCVPASQHSACRGSKKR